VKLCFFPTEVDYDLASCLFSEDSLLSLSIFLNSAACKCGSVAEMDWTWIRTIANFVEFVLDPECKALKNLGSGQDLDWVNGKEMGHFCCEHFSNFLDFIWTWEIFGLWLDLDWVLKNQDWVWIAKHDSPLIFGPQIIARQHQKSIFALH